HGSQPQPGPVTSSGRCRHCLGSRADTAPTALSPAPDSGTSSRGRTRSQCAIQPCLFLLNGRPTASLHARQVSIYPATLACAAYTLPLSFHFLKIRLTS